MINSAQSPDDLEAAEAQKQVNDFLSDILGSTIETEKKQLIEKQTNCFSMILGLLLVVAIVLIVVVIVCVV
jgi:CHASE3 domain sensor protein